MRSISALVAALVAALLVFAGAAALSPAHTNDTTGTSVSIRVIDAVSGERVNDATVELLGQWWNHRPQFNPATGAYDLSVDDSSARS